PRPGEADARGGAQPRVRAGRPAPRPDQRAPTRPRLARPATRLSLGSMSEERRRRRSTSGKRYDATTKHLVEQRPADRLAYAGLVPAGRAGVVSAELSTFTAEADHVLRVDEPRPWLVHLEFQSRRDRAMAERLLRYNVLLRGREGLPVQSVVLLLAP